MEEIVRLELFSVVEVKQWLISGISLRGLSEKVIARQRAYAIINNPYVTYDLKIISALFVNDHVAAYTYLFPDKVRVLDEDGNPMQKLIYWNTALYCDPKYEGRGYAFCVIGQFCELYGDDYFDLDAAPASIENLKYAGLHVEFLNQYQLSRKSIGNAGLKSILARIKEKCELYLFSNKRSLIKQISTTKYSLEYVDFIDDETYDFICKHATNDLFLRSHEMLNWILKYPLMRSCPLLSRVDRDNVFSSNRKIFAFYGVRILVDNQLVGFYIYSDSKEIWYLNYLYYDTNYEKEVYYSIAEHVIHSDRVKIHTSDEKLWKFLSSYNLYSKSYIQKKSFSYPANFIYNQHYQIQAGDGDNIT
jgi:hypothetical protein